MTYLISLLNKFRKNEIFSVIFDSPNPASKKSLFEMLQEKASKFNKNQGDSFKNQDQKCNDGKISHFSTFIGNIWNLLFLESKFLSFLNETEEEIFRKKLIKK